MLPEPVLPLSPKAQKELAKAVDYFRNNKLDEAIKHFENAQRLAPTHPDVVYLLGETYEKKGELTAARKSGIRRFSLIRLTFRSLLAGGESYLRQNDARQCAEVSGQSG